MKIGEVVIVVARDHVRVMRYCKGDTKPITAESATNWRRLEQDAISAVKAIGGSRYMLGHYPCPKELANRATWPTHTPCERCGKLGAQPHSLRVKVESVYGGTSTQTAGFTLCTPCFEVGSDLEPIEDVSGFLHPLEVDQQQ